MAQVANILVALVCMWLVPTFRCITDAHRLPMYLFGMVLLIGVALFGEISHGARRWLNLGVATIQPSELMKIAVPLMMAWYFRKKRGRADAEKLHYRSLVAAAAGGIDRAPARPRHRRADLGQRVLCAVSRRLELARDGRAVRRGARQCAGAVVDAARLPEAPHHDAARPDAGRAGQGLSHHSGHDRGRLRRNIGKGYLNGTQTHLDFLPERTTDFIFAVYSEEFGLLGNLILLGLFLFVIGRGFIITANASTYFTRLMAGSITLTFFTYAFVNMGMVSGILPVVGVPLPWSATAAHPCHIAAGIWYADEHSYAQDVVQT